jgi:Leucine-rich repeat (LRR) protein
MAGLVNLRVLDLSGNPLWRPPVLTRLQALEELDLSGTDLTQWPTGLERLPNISSADLRYLAITQVPDGAGRTRGLRMSSEHLEPAVRQQFEADMNAVGNVYSDSEESMDEDSGKLPHGERLERCAAPVRRFQRRRARVRPATAGRR